VRVNPVVAGGAEGGLDAAVLAAVKADEGGDAAGLRQAGGDRQAGASTIGQLAVFDRMRQGLKRSGGGVK